MIDYNKYYDLPLLALQVSCSSLLAQPLDPPKSKNT